MIQRRILSLVFVITIILFVCPLFVNTVSAAPCTCFCATTKQGAVKVGDNQMEMDACEKLCKENGTEVVVCASKISQFPIYNKLCFKSEECSDVGGVWQKEQGRECASGYRYCFPDPKKSEVKLNVEIGGLKTVGDLGIYIQEIYKWMLGVAGVIAVVMMMIGGLQWVLAAGSEDIGKAKERIKNGAIGLILLVSVVLILQTVNPELIKLQMPQPSLIKRAVIMTSCEEYEKQKYKIELEDASKKKECGTFGALKRTPEGIEVTDGSSCMYKFCRVGGCVGSGDDMSCVECAKVGRAAENNIIKPSQSTCGSISTEQRNTKGELVKGNLCLFDANIVSGGACLDVSISCGNVTNCESYNSQLSLEYYDLDNVSRSGTPMSTEFREKFGKICSDDPCGVAKKSDGKIEQCKWSRNNLSAPVSENNPEACRSITQ